MTSDKREKAIKYLTEEIRSLRIAPQINGCGPENWAEQLEVMETCLEAVRSVHFADAVPVVRCRECRHYRETRTKRYGNLICRCTRMGKHDMDYTVKPDDFCSYGER